jgi:hypothetical protein
MGQIQMKIEVARQIEKLSFVKFYENPSSGSGVFPYGLVELNKRCAELRTLIKSFTSETAKRVFM